MASTSKKTFHGTKAEFDLLPSNGDYYCPNCGLAITTPYPGCRCPTRFTLSGFEYVEHINKYHHDCNKAWEQAYGKKKWGRGTR